MSFSRIHIEAILLKTDLIRASINKIKKASSLKAVAVERFKLKFLHEEEHPPLIHEVCWRLWRRR